MKPSWLDVDKPVDSSEIAEEDYPYLAAWLDENGKNPQDYLVDLYAEHQIVIFGEVHLVREHKDFIIDLIPKLYHEAGLRCIGWEFSKHRDNQRLNDLVNGSRFDRDRLFDFAREQDPEWNSREHWDMIEAVWRLNRSLDANDERMRFVGLGMDLDILQHWLVAKTKPEDSSEYKKWVIDPSIRYDQIMAEQVEKEMLQTGQKGLVFVGRHHDQTHYKWPPSKFWGREPMGYILHQKYGNRIFQVWPHAGWLPIIEDVMALRGHRTIGFDLYASPFANICYLEDKHGCPGAMLSNLARGYVYLMPRKMLHSNTTIKGYVTKQMFQRYRHYYEADFGRSFEDAIDVDRYLQTHRWPKP